MERIGKPLKVLYKNGYCTMFFMDIRFTYSVIHECVNARTLFVLPTPFYSIGIIFNIQRTTVGVISQPRKTGMFQ